MPTIITASRITPLIQLLYTLLVVRSEDSNKKAPEDAALEISRLAKEVLPMWSKALPGLRPALLATLKGKGQDEAVAQLGAEIKQLAPLGKADKEVPLQDLEILSALGLYFRKSSEGALNKLRKLASVSGSPWVVQKLVPKVGDQQSTKAQLEKLVQTLVGRKDSALTLEEAKQVKELKPQDYSTYLSLRREFNQAWKDALVAYIRRSGSHKVDYSKALDYLKLNGIDHLMPQGFSGQIDDLGRLYTSKGELIEGLPNAVTFPTVVMNKSYGKPNGGDWVFMAQRANGDPGPYFYTSAYKKGQSKAKFAKVEDLSKVIDQMHRRWFSKVKNFSEADPRCVAAVVLEILYEFSARIGSVGNQAGGQSTYGVATLLAKHAIIDPAGNIVLRYKGKDGVATVHKLMRSDPEQKAVITALNTLLTGKEPRERIFTVVKGKKRVPITPGQVNALFKACGAPEGVTVHKLRTVAGTKLFTDLMDEVLAKRKPNSEKAAMELFKKMAEVVGKRLNHVRRGASGTKVTGTTALAAYIDPTAQLAFWYSVGYRIPKFLEKYDALLGKQ
jgi:hypothetical protein